MASQVLRTLARADDRTLLLALRRALGERSVALCFHRVLNGPRRKGELRPKLSMPSAEIDALLGAVQTACRGKLTVSFDDGYRDSAEYILSRAGRHPDVEWLFFLCPQKTERRAGFRWDLAERRADLDPEETLAAPVDLAAENDRADLRGLADDLAELALCREVQRLPNAMLGNHTNVHHRLTLLSPAEPELLQSTRDFERLFGPQRHFAFPFGVPGVDYSAAHVGALRALGTQTIWSTEPRPYSAGERFDGAVLPRFAVDGTRTWKETVAQIAIHALRTRVLPPAPLERNELR